MYIELQLRLYELKVFAHCVLPACPASPGMHPLLHTRILPPSAPPRGPLRAFIRDDGQLRGGVTAGCVNRRDGAAAAEVLTPPNSAAGAAAPAAPLSLVHTHVGATHARSHARSHFSGALQKQCVCKWTATCGQMKCHAASDAPRVSAQLQNMVRNWWLGNTKPLC